MLTLGEPQGERREMTSTSTDILNLIDGFIDQISKIRTILKGVSISALILAPLAIVLIHLFLSELILSHFYPSHNQLTSHMPSTDSKLIQ